MSQLYSNPTDTQESSQEESIKVPLYNPGDVLVYLSPSSRRSKIEMLSEDTISFWKITKQVSRETASSYNNDYRNYPEGSEFYEIVSKHGDVRVTSSDNLIPHSNSFDLLSNFITAYEAIKSCPPFFDAGETFLHYPKDRHYIFNREQSLFLVLEKYSNFFKQKDNNAILQKPNTKGKVKRNRSSGDFYGSRP